MCSAEDKQDILKYGKPKPHINITLERSAFDNVGFEHLEQTLNTQPLPTRLRELIKTLTKGNFTTIHSSGSKSDELTEKHIIDQFGFQINSDLDSLTISAFADDIVVIGKSMNAAQELVMMVTSLLQNIGLQLNVHKSASINIHKGKLLEKDLFLHHDSYIKAIGPEDTIKYLGITFNDELQFNSEELIVSLRQDLKLLISRRYRCRHGCPEIETLAHVLGFCEQGLLLRNSRHHLVRSKIAAALRTKGWIVEEEISCLAENGSTRRVDILAYNAATKQGIIVDPTIRFEVGCHQSAEVHLEKKSIYEPTVNYFKLKYALIHVESGFNQLEIHFTTADQANKFLDSDFDELFQTKSFIPNYNIMVHGVIGGVDPDISITDIINDISVSEGFTVTNAYRLNYKSTNENGETCYKPSSKVKLTFRAQKLPQYVVLYYQRREVQVYKEHIIQCNNCGLFNHKTKFCRNVLRCMKCGGSHNTDECQEEKLCCVNCKQAHCSTELDKCPKYNLEKNIADTIQSLPVSKYQAKQILKGQTNYASILRKNSNSQVIGAIDGTHIPITNVGGELSQIYINRKGWYSLLNVQLLSRAWIRFLLGLITWMDFSEVFPNIKANVSSSSLLLTLNSLHTNLIRVISCTGISGTWFSYYFGCNKTEVVTKPSSTDTSAANNTNEYHSGSQCNSLVFEVKLDIPTISPVTMYYYAHYLPNHAFKKKYTKTRQVKLCGGVGSSCDINKA
ncbi:hypothetical protein ANN_18665 [Periplaneta americana]|uniref:Reverse transcriptase domain-containing protein n=1 Tax=Periplaneta americana TaxID=6978 RepID=A0ABQ8SQ26_PERAM|nr:hypothetical protein ANN_18665 [Periplaneta americana]